MFTILYEVDGKISQIGPFKNKDEEFGSQITTLTTWFSSHCPRKLLYVVGSDLILKSVTLENLKRNLRHPLEELEEQPLDQWTVLYVAKDQILQLGSLNQIFQLGPFNRNMDALDAIRQEDGNKFTISDDCGVYLLGPDLKLQEIPAPVTQRIRVNIVLNLFRKIDVDGDIHTYLETLVNEVLTENMPSLRKKLEKKQWEIEHNAWWSVYFPTSKSDTR